MPKLAPLPHQPIPIYSEKRSKIVFIERDRTSKQAVGYFKTHREMHRIPDRELRALVVKAISDTEETLKRTQADAYELKARVAMLVDLL